MARKVEKSVYFTPTQVEAAEEKADELGISLSAYVRDLITRDLN